MGNRRLYMDIQFDDEKVQALLRQMRDAIDTFQDCYSELRNQGIIVIKDDSDQQNS